MPPGVVLNKQVSFLDMGIDEGSDFVYPGTDLFYLDFNYTFNLKIARKTGQHRAKAALIAKRQKAITWLEFTGSDPSAKNFCNLQIG